MENKDWLKSLENKETNNINKFLSILEIDFSNIMRICVSGNSFRVTTITALKEVLNIKKFNSGVIIFSSELDKMISYKNRFIDDESFEFHLGCIKTIAEESNLEVGYFEAIYLAGLNFFREQKAPIIIVEDSFSFIKDIEFNKYLLTDYSTDESIYSYSKIDKKDYYLYKSELCSFNYKNIDYDVLNYGSFNALSYILAISFINDYYPEIKDKKMKNIINDIKPNFIYERVNRNPRVIVNYIVSDDEVDESINNLKSITDRKIITVSNIDSNVDYKIKGVSELKDIINNADINDIVLIIINKFLVKDIRLFFIN